MKRYLLKPLFVVIMTIIAGAVGCGGGGGSGGNNNPDPGMTIFQKWINQQDNTITDFTGGEFGRVIQFKHPDNCIMYIVFTLNTNAAKGTFGTLDFVSGQNSCPGYAGWRLDYTVTVNAGKQTEGEYWLLLNDPSSYWSGTYTSEYKK